MIVILGLFCFGYSGPIYAAAVRSRQDVLSGAETPEERFALVDFGIARRKALPDAEVWRAGTTGYPGAGAAKGILDAIRGGVEVAIVGNIG